MQKYDLTFNPFLMLFWKEIRRFLKVLVQTIFTPAVNSSLYLVIFGVSLGKSIDVGQGIPYLSFLISGLIVMAFLNNAFQNTASSIVSGKFSGDLEDLKVVPLSRAQIIWAMSFGAITRGFVVSLVVMTVGQMFHFFSEGYFLNVYSYPILFVFLIMGGLIYAKLGMFVAFLAKSFDQMSAVASLILQPLSYLGGVFFSLNNLSPFWQKVSLINPVFYLINGVRFAVLGKSDVDPIRCFLVAVVSLVCFHLLVFVTLKRGEFRRW